jgi:antitoxin (DNA-binding transcriptional repressor) of toxin-antitoxin stability system
MKALTVAQAKTNFSDVLVDVKSKSKEPVAMIVPMKNIDVPRKIGVLDGKATFKEKETGKITEAEFLGL